MYYKITNKKSKIYKDLFEFRKKEKSIDKRNSRLIQEKSGSTFKNYLGFPPQTGLIRTRHYVAFDFEQPENLDDKTWKKNKDHEELYEPYLRTKKGREMNEFINNLERTSYWDLKELIGLDSLHKFHTPDVYIVEDDVLIMYLDPRHIPEDENFIEITSVEFDELFYL